MTALALAALLAPAQAQEVRALHLSPDAPNVDIFVDNGAQPAITDLAYQEGTGYVALPMGVTNFKVSATGTPASAAVLDFDLPLAQGMRYSAVAFGNLSNIDALALVDDSSGLAQGDVRLQVVHAADGIGDVNVIVGGIGGVRADFPYGDSFVADLPAGAYTVGLDIDLDRIPDFRFDVPELSPGWFVNVFAAIDADGPYLLAWLPNGDTLRIDGEAVDSAGIRAVHLSPDAPAVDVWVDGQLAVEDLAFEDVQGPLPVAPGPHRIEVVAAGTMGPAVIDRQMVFEEGRDYSVIAFGNLANIEEAKMKVGNCPAGPGSYCIQAFHAADGVGPVDLWDLDAGVPVVTRLGYGDRDAVMAAAGAFTLGLDADRDGSADFSFDIPDVGDQINLQVFAVLDAMGSPFLQVVLDDASVVRIDAN